MARLIRGAGATSRRISPDVSSAQGEASAILERAEREAARIRQDAEGDARAIVADAEARRGEAARAEAVAARLRHLEEAERVRRGARSDLLRLSISVSRRVIGAELRSHPEQLASTLDETLKRAGVAERLELHVSPEDAEVARGLEPAGLPEGAFVVRLDPSLSRGDCRVRLPGGNLDGRVETRLAAIGRALGLES